MEGPIPQDTPRTVVIGGATLPMKTVFQTLSDRDLWNEARRRGLVDEWGDFVHPNNTVRSDLEAIPDWTIRQNVPEALRDVEAALSEVDSRFIGFASDVERHYAGAA